MFNNIYLKIIGIVHKVGWQKIVLIFICLGFLIASLRISWSLLDDGVSVIISNKISQSIQNFDFKPLAEIFLEKESGRFRPFYWVFNWVLITLANHNVQIVYLLHSLILVATSVIIYNIIEKISNNKYGALLGASFFCFTSINVENWFRLGPAESIIGLLVSILFLLLHKYINRDIKNTRKFIIYSVIVLVLLYLTKETSLILAPFLLFVLFCLKIFKFKTNASVKKGLWSILLVSVLLLCIVYPFVYLVKKGGSYSNYYQLNPKDLLITLKLYLESISFSLYPFLEIFSTIFILRNIDLYLKESNLFTKIFLWEILSLGLFSLYLLIQLPWGFPINRYLLPALVGFSVFWGLELGIFLNYLLKKQSVYCWLFLGLYLLVFIYNNIFQTINYYEITSKATNATKSVLSELAKIAPINSKVYINAIESDATIEPVLEAGYHLANFYDRPDLIVSYLNDENYSKVSNASYVLSSFVSTGWRFKTDEELSTKGNLSKVNTYVFELNNYSNVSSKYVIRAFLGLDKGIFTKKLLGNEIKQEIWYLYSSN